MGNISATVVTEACTERKWWKDRRGNEVEWEVGDLTDKRAMEKQSMFQLYKKKKNAPDSGSV